MPHVAQLTRHNCVVFHEAQLHVAAPFVHRASDAAHYVALGRDDDVSIDVEHLDAQCAADVERPNGLRLATIRSSCFICHRVRILTRRHAQFPFHHLLLHHSQHLVAGHAALDLVHELIVLRHWEAVASKQRARRAVKQRAAAGQRVHASELDARARSVGARKRPLQWALPEGYE